MLLVLTRDQKTRWIYVQAAEVQEAMSFYRAAGFEVSVDD